MDLKKIIRKSFILIFLIIIFIFISLFIKNYNVAIILSESMEPTLKVDDLVIVKKNNDFKVGDIISFKDGNDVIMHRVIEINDDNIITKGDANNTSDAPITKDKVIGVYVGKIILLGNIVSFIKTPLGMVLFILLMLFAVALTMFDYNDPKKKKYKILLFALIYIIILISSIIICYKARYRSETNGNDSTTVASIAINKSQTLEVNTSDLYPGIVKKYRFGIKNSNDNASEVSMGYSIKVESTNNLPLTYSLKCIDKTGGTGISENAFTQISTNTLVSGGILPYGNYVHTYELSIEWNENENDAKYANKIEIINIIIDSKQID